MTTTLGQFWFNLFLLNLCIFISHRHARKIKERRISWLLLLLFCLFAFWDIDYFGLYDMYTGYTDRGNKFVDFLYPWLARISFGSYTLFRLFIWGTAELLFYKMAKLLGLNRNLTIYVMIMNFMFLFSYARASLGMAFYFYGIIYFSVSKNRHKLLYLLICLFMAFCSHRSMLILIGLTPLFFIKLTRNRVVLILVFFVVFLVPFLRYALLNVAETDVNESGGLMDNFNQSAHNYSQLGVSYVVEDNWKFALIKYLRNFSLLLGTAISLYIILQRKNIKFINKTMKQLLLLIVGIVLTGLAFLIQKTFGSEIIGYRILYMSGIPIVLLLTYLAENRYCSWKLLHFAFLPAFLFQEGFIIGKIISLGII